LNIFYQSVHFEVKTMNSFLKQIIFQDDFILIVEKPSMLLSVPGRGESKYDSVTTRLQSLFNEIYVVHRLDWETSGLMVFAKSKSSQKNLNQQFMQRLVHKQYQAIVFGHLKGQGMINFPLMADWERRPKQKVDYNNGKSAITYWQTLAVSKQHSPISNQHYVVSHINLTPITGRSHQLRVHLAALSHPILGDQLYAQPLAVNMANRLQLHACYLSFLHPFTDQQISFESPCSFSLDQVT
jgi:tRNA pseudouridine32 synthase / 23S rRNA pseudouridine746 synthase